MNHVLATNGLGMYKTTNVLECWYNIGDKDQGQIN